MRKADEKVSRPGARCSVWPPELYVELCSGCHGGSRECVASSCTQVGHWVAFPPFQRSLAMEGEGKGMHCPTGPFGLCCVTSVNYMPERI